MVKPACPREGRDSPSKNPTDSPNRSGARELYPLGTLVVPSGREWMARQAINGPPPSRPTMLEGQAQADEGTITQGSVALPQHRDSRAKGSLGQASALATILALARDQQTSRAKIGS